MPKPTLDVLSAGLGFIHKEQNNINVKFFEATVPFKDSSFHVALNTGGAVRLIMIQGMSSGDGYTGSTVEDKMGDFVYEMEEWVNSSSLGQQRALFTDSLGNTYWVVAVDWQWTRLNTNPNMLVYTLIMKQVANFGG